MSTENVPNATQKYIGFLAGIASGATKLAVGHPFGELRVS